MSQFNGTAENIENNLNKVDTYDPTLPDEQKAKKYPSLKCLIDIAHPIGSLYWSSDPTNPGDLFGGTWKQIKDTFILAKGDTYTNVDDVIRGEASVTLTKNQLPKVNGAFATAVVGQHAIRGIKGDAYGTDFGEISDVAGIKGTVINANSGEKQYGYGISFGNNEAHNNMPPYLVRYCWERTA